MSFTSWRGKQADAMRERIRDFLCTYPHGHFLLVIYTYADVATGGLCDSYAEDGVTALHLSVEELCKFFLGTDVLSALRSHTGQCGLLMLACGPVMGPGHIKSVQNLVKM